METNIFLLCRQMLSFQQKTPNRAPQAVTKSPAAAGVSSSKSATLSPLSLSCSSPLLFSSKTSLSSSNSMPNVVSQQIMPPPKPTTGPDFKSAPSSFEFGGLVRASSSLENILGAQEWRGAAGEGNSSSVGIKEEGEEEMDLINVNSVLYDKNTGSMNVALPVNSSSDLSQSPSPPAHIDNEKVLQDLKLLTRVHPTTSITSVIGNYSKPETPRATIYKLTRMDMVKNQVSAIQNGDAPHVAKFKNQQLHSFTPTRKAAVDLKRVTTLKPLFSKLASSSSSSTTTTTTITGSDLGDRLPMMDSFTATTYQLQQLQENNKNFDDDFDDEALDLVLEETKAEILLQHGKLTLGQELAAGGMSPPDFLESASSLKKAGSSFHDKEKSNGFSSPLKKVTFGFTNNHTSNLDNSLFKVNQVSLSSSKPEASGNTVSQHYNHEDISLSEISKKDLEESIDLMNSSCNDLDNMNSSYVEDNGLFSKNDNQEQVFNMSLISNLTLPEDFHLSQLPEMDLEEIWKTGDFASKMLFDEEGDDENNEMQDKEEDDANTKSSGAGNSKNNSGLGSSTSDTSQLQKQFIGLFAGSRRVGGGEEDNNEDDDGEHWLNSVAHSNDPDSSSISDVLYMGLRHRIKEIKAEVLRKKIEATQSIVKADKEDEEISAMIMSEEEESNYVQDVEKLHLDIKVLKDRLRAIESTMPANSADQQKLDESIRVTLARIQEWDQKLEIQSLDSGAKVSPSFSVFNSMGQTLMFTFLIVVIMTTLWLSFLFLSIWMKLDQLYKEHDDILYEIGGADISPSAYIFRFLALMMGIELQGANNLDDRIVPT